MTQTQKSADVRRKLTMERTWHASLEDIWDLWATKDGIESWWGPEGFSVTVQTIDLRPGGHLLYTMTAIGEAEIQFMKNAGMPLSTPAKVTYTEVTPHSRLGYTTLTDFVPGVDPYEVQTVVELHAQGADVRMVLTFDAMHDDHWTEQQRAGHESQLRKLEALLADRA